MLEIVFDLGSFENVEIVPIADVHIGNPNCHEAELKRIIDYILEEPSDPKMARICLLNGDLTESATKTNRNGNVFEQTMTPSVQVATMIKYLLPLTETSKKYPMGKILSYCAGNHDGDRYKETGISAAESIAVGLGLQDRFSENGCYSFVRVKKVYSNTEPTFFTVYNQHMTGGASTVGGKANRIQKISSAVYADLIVGSHVHLPMTFKEDFILPNLSNQNHTLEQKTITYVITGSLLGYGDYAQKMGLRPSTITFPKIFLCQEKHGAKGKRIKHIEVLL